MTTSDLRIFHGVPAIFLDGHPISAPIAAYVGPQHTGTFQQAGVQLYTFYIAGKWWLGPGQYNFALIDNFLQDYLAKIPAGYFMPRIDLSQQGYPWWGQAHPEEMNLLLDLQTGQPIDQTIPNPKALPYLGHEVNLAGLNLHSYHSEVWRKEAGEAVAALVAHCEAGAYADRIWAWHLCDGLFCEWFHWNEYSFDGLADYSPAAQADFQRWLTRIYQTDEALSQAWGREAHIATAAIPTPQARMRITHGEFYDPILDRPTIDYHQCFSDATVDCIISICHAAKSALPQPKVTCVFYGYQFSNMPRPQLNAHYALERLLASPAIDMIASPHTYSNRGEGGYHSSQTPVDALRRAGKLHFDEIDCKTVWTPASVTWKRHISQPTTVEGTVEMMKKDAAFQIASGTAQWWMDLTDQGWFDAPEVVEPIRRLKSIEQRMQGKERNFFGEVAFVVSQRSMQFQSPREGLHNVTLKMFRNWHLSRMGAPFEQLLVSDLARSDLPEYKLFIMANLFYLSAAERQLIAKTLKRNHATALWIYAPGFLDDQSAALENMQALTGFRFGMVDRYGEQNVTLTDFDHSVTQGLAFSEYGSGVNREQYLQPPKIQYLPQTEIGPSFFVDDPDAHILGTAQNTGRPGLAVKTVDGWRSIYSAAPLLPWPLMRNIARFAGVHIYDGDGDMLWANNNFLAVYSQQAGKRTLRFPKPCDVTDAYADISLGRQITLLDLNMEKWETKLLFMD
jgi:hypothetical protein